MSNEIYLQCILDQIRAIREEYSKIYIDYSQFDSNQLNELIIGLDMFNRSAHEKYIKARIEENNRF